MVRTAEQGSIRTALVGYGVAGSVFHAPLISATDGMTLTTVVTANEQRAAAVRERYPDVRVAPNVEQLWREPGRLDLVVIASPNRTHLPLALAAIRARLPVVVDKPVAATAAQARQLPDAAAEKGVLVSVFHNRRWDGDALTVRRLIADGSLGTIFRFESRYERWRPEVNAQAWRERPAPEEAGGLLYDLGSHLIDQALTLFGPVTDVYAEVRAVRRGAQVDDDVFLAIAHRSGTCSHLWASSAAADLGPRFRVLGTSGSYRKYGLDVQEAALRAGRTPGKPGWGEEPDTSWGQLGTPGHTRPVPTRPGNYGQYYADLRDALRGKRDPPVTVDSAIDVLVVIEAARRSASERATVRVTPS